MKTLHVTKDIREKFCSHAAAITKLPRREIDKNGKKRTSDTWLQMIFEELRVAKYDGTWHKTRTKIQPSGELEGLLRQQIATALPIPADLVTFNEAVWYPPGGYHEWTDGVTSPGWHAQFIYAAQPDRSFMKTYHDGHFTTHFDKGFDFRMFYVTNPNRGEFRYWHTVYTEVDRVVVDFILRKRGRAAF